MKDTNKSDVARFRQRVDEEYEAAQRGLTGPAIVSRHDFIQARMEGIATAFEQLVQDVGEQEATRLLCEIPPASSPTPSQSAPTA